MKFEPLVFYENTNLKVSNFYLKKFEAIFSLLRRKHSKEVILNALYDLIKSNYSIKIIKMIFEKISHLIKKVFLPSKNRILNRNHSIAYGEKFEDNKNSFDLIKPIVYSNSF